MNNNDRLLQTITDETKNSVHSMKVVTPSIYSSIFASFSKEYDAVIEDEKGLSHELLDEQCSTFTKIQKETSRNAQNLSDNTQKALSAIHDKDESALNEVLQETQALKEEIEKLKAAVYIDALTNIYNRKWLHDNILDHETNQFNKAGTLAIIDLNYFKAVNDTHGHVVGDKVLSFIAHEIKKSRYDVVRYGGDEFVIIFPQNINEEQAFSIMDEIREKVLNKKLRAHDKMFRTSFSIGVSSYTTEDNLNTILEVADKNMYDDKVQIKKRITGIEI